MSLDKLQALIAKTKKTGEKEVKVATGLRNAAQTIRSLPAPVCTIPALVRVYMDVIKDTDGMTSARPATLKAVQTAAQRADPKTVGAAIDELRRHVEDLKPKSSSNRSGFDKFSRDVNSLIDKLNALLR
jgi:hypothetical protein